MEESKITQESTVPDTSNTTMAETADTPAAPTPAVEVPAVAGETQTTIAPAEPVTSTIPSETTQNAVEISATLTEQPAEAPAPETTTADDVMNVEADESNLINLKTPTGPSTEPENAEMSGTNEASSEEPAAQPHVTDALEALLSGSMDVDAAPTAAAAAARSIDAAAVATEDQVIQPTGGPNEETAEGEGVDWEVDSSPYESSSSDSDSSDDSDDDDEAGADADMLGVQETVRMLMESAMQDSDDDEDGGNRGGGNIRSKNEEPETAPPKPEIEIGADDEIVLLGPILHIVENSAVIQGNTDGAYRVLDHGSVLCKADRTVVGVVADVIGNVRSPMYVLRFAQSSDLLKDGLAQGQDLFYPTKHAQFVFTEELRNIKGSDASNLHDEEVGADEAEFSDDEKEAAYKRELKARRRGGGAAGGNNDRNGAQGVGGKRAQNNKGHPLRNEASNNGNDGLRYDDDDDDGPYKPLTRPANFGQGASSLPPVPPPSVNANNSGGAGGHTNNGSFRGQSRFNGGRGGGFGGGRGNRGGGFRGRGGHDNRGGRGGGWNSGQRNNSNNNAGNNSYSGNGQQSQFNFNPSAPPPPPPPQSYQQQSSAPVAPWPFAGMPFPPPPPPPAGGAAPNAASMAAAAALLNNVQIQQILQQHQQAQQQQQRQQAAAAPSWPGMPAAPPQPAYQYQHQQPPQPTQQQQQQAPAANAAFNPASFQYLFQGGQGQQQPPPPPPGWGQQPPPSS
ncbi:hypothetical protein SBRCBS47491_007259 [Sporothrix bragantina]|uniref:H/ACA ribonucleoprotein complex non-core subunit NAF1 n=1 Tax=Sporothrix bragantina TaxID=671064 RepID=A0ABP0CCB6_9PEZI